MAKPKGEVVIAADTVSAGLGMAQSAGEGLRAPGFEADFELVSPSGKIERWHWNNLVTTQGKQELLSRTLGGKTAAYTWYMGLMGTPATGGSAPAVGDVLSNHVWAETCSYGTASNATGSTNRIAVTGFQSTTPSTMQSATAQFVFISAANIGGAFVADVQATSGTNGILYSAGSYTATRGVGAGDTLNATVSVSMS